MAEPALKRSMSYAEYLAQEEVDDLKHLWWRGEVFAMAGGSGEHAWLSGQVILLIGGSLRKTPCRIYSSDLRVRVDAADMTAYPDAQIICGRRVAHEDDASCSTNPVVLFEVLSDSTEKWDRGGKFEAYAQLPSLQHYVLISQGKNRVEHFRRNEDGSWRYVALGPGQTLELDGLCSVAVDELYAGVEIERVSPSAG
jgi:Uma2 family endonuclease